MTKKPVSLLLQGAALFLAAVVSAEVTVRATRQLTLSTTGGAPIGSSGSPVVSVNGGFLAFRSSAANLIASDTNGQDDIFIRDLSRGTVSRASISSSGAEGNRPSREPAISPVNPDGVFLVAFTSSSTTLGSVPNPDFVRNVYLRIPSRNLTEVISFGPNLEVSNGDSSSPSVTLLPGSTRALVAFSSNATNLARTDVNDVADVFLSSVTLPGAGGFSDLAAAVTTTLISSGSAASDGASTAPRISGDGKFVVFVSEATNLIAGTKLSGAQIYRYDVDSARLELVSRNGTGQAANADCSAPSISFSGRYVSYVTSASNLVSGAGGSRSIVVLHDLLKGTVVQVNTATDGESSNGQATAPMVTGNGRFVAFSDDGSNLVSDDSGGLSDVFLRDLDTGTTTRISTAVSGTPDGASDSTVVAGDSYNSLSRSLYFRSFATNLTTPSSSSGAGDIFGRDAVFPAPQLRKGSLIEAPADVRIKGKRSVIVAQKFSFPKTSPLVVAGAAIADRARVQKRITYQFRVQGTARRKNVRLDLTSKRNQITTSRLPPGVYNARYRATATQGKKVVSRTPFSPRQQFEIR